MNTISKMMGPIDNFWIIYKKKDRRSCLAHHMRRGGLLSKILRGKDYGEWKRERPKSNYSTQTSKDIGCADLCGAKDKCWEQEMAERQDQTTSKLVLRLNNLKTSYFRVQSLPSTQAADEAGVSSSICSQELWGIIIVAVAIVVVTTLIGLFNIVCGERGQNSLKVWSIQLKCAVLGLV